MMMDNTSQCCICQRWLDRASFSATQIKKPVVARTCFDCTNNPFPNGFSPEQVASQVAMNSRFDYVRFGAGPPVRPTMPGTSSGAPACVRCGQCKMSVKFSAESLCMDCQSGRTGAKLSGNVAGHNEDPFQDMHGLRKCSYCNKMLPKASFSVSQLKKKGGQAQCTKCIDTASWYPGIIDPQDYFADAPRQCAACGDWKTPNEFSAAQIRILDTPRCEICIAAGKEIDTKFKRLDLDSRSLRPTITRRRSSSSGSSSSSSKKKRKAKRSKKKKKRRKRSTSSSSSSSSVKSVKSVKDDEPAAETSSNPEVDKVKKEVLDQLVKMKDVEPREAKMKQFRALLRQWHPDKNPNKVEVATAVFQFVQKGKTLVGL